MVSIFGGVIGVTIHRSNCISTSHSHRQTRGSYHPIQAQTCRAPLAKRNAAVFSDCRLPDPRLDGEADAVGPVAGPRLLRALVVVLAVDADSVGRRGAEEGGEEDG